MNHAGDSRRLGEREVFQLLAEEDARRLADAAHGNRAALSQVNLVAVEREDVLLPYPALDDGGERRLVELAAQRALRRQVRVLDELLRDGRAALLEVLIYVAPAEGGAGDAPEVYGAVLEEAAVFG